MSSKGPYIDPPPPAVRRRGTALRRPLLLALCGAVAALSLFACNLYLTTLAHDARRAHRVPAHAARVLRQCAAHRATPGPPPGFATREQSDRFEPGTRPTLIKNARIWTGARNGTEEVKGDALLSGGVDKGIGYIPRALLDGLTELVTVDAEGSWVTPGLGA